MCVNATADWTPLITGNTIQVTCRLKYDAKLNQCKSKKIKLELRQEGKSAASSTVIGKAELDLASYSTHELDTVVKIPMRGPKTKAPLNLHVRLSLMSSQCVRDRT